jgi:hypothetical protein
MTQSARPRPEIGYWHLWVDGDGVSHQARCEATVVHTVQPVGWVGDWHENPAPQWIIVLSGRWWIESMDGMRIEQGPGEFSFGENQGCTLTNGRRGHRSGTIGEAPAVLMTVQLHIPPTRAPCRFT